MRVMLAAAAVAFLSMCGPPELPPAEHGGVVVLAGSEPLEVVTFEDGQLAAYPLGSSMARGPTTTILLHVPGIDGAVHDAPLAWTEATASFVGSMPVAPRLGPLEIDIVIAGAPQHVTVPIFVVLVPAASTVVVARGPVIVERPRARIDVVATPPAVVVVPPSPTVVVVEPGVAPPATDVLRVHDLHADSLTARVVYAHDVHAASGRVGRVILGDDTRESRGARDIHGGAVSADVVYAHDIHVDRLDASEIHAHRVHMPR